MPSGCSTSPVAHLRVRGMLQMCLHVNTCIVVDGTLNCCVIYSLHEAHRFVCIDLCIYLYLHEHSVKSCCHNQSNIYSTSISGVFAGHRSHQSTAILSMAFADTHLYSQTTHACHSCNITIMLLSDVILKPLTN